MKKLIPYMLALLLLGLCACTKNDGGSSDNGESSDPASTNGSSAVSVTPEDQFEYEDYYDGVLITNYIGSDRTVNVPDTIGGRKVLRVEMLNDEVTELILPKCVKELYMPDSCTALKRLTAPGFDGGFSTMHISDEVSFNYLDISGAETLESYDGMPSVKEIKVPQYVAYIPSSEESGMLLVTEAFANTNSVEITDENRASVYCDFFNSNVITVNGVEYSR